MAKGDDARSLPGHDHSRGMVVLFSVRLKRLYPGARRGCEHVAGDAPVNPAFPILTDFSPKEFQPIFAYQMVAYTVQ